MASNEKPNSDNLETVKSEKNEKSLNINNTLSERIPINNNIKNNMNSNEPNQDLKKNIINKITINKDRNNEEEEKERRIILQKKQNINYTNMSDISYKLKCYFILLGAIGICYIILFIVGCSNKKVGFMFNIFFMCIIGIFLLFNAIFSFNRAPIFRIGNNILLLIFSIICLIFSIIGVIIIAINKKAKRYLACSIIFGILNFIIDLLLIINICKMRKYINEKKEKKLNINKK